MARRDDPNRPFRPRSKERAAKAAAPLVHRIRKSVRCGTEKRGFATPHAESPARIVVDASEGFIPLWAPGVSLYWRFQERSMAYFEDPEAAKEGIQSLFGQTVLAWGEDVAPVKFVMRNDNWDFEIVMSGTDDCDPNGCVLASAFFPDAGRHELWLYPKLFTLDLEEQVETFVHEIGHIFGLRHFFAQVSERRWRSEIFGEHEPFSIMNYGEESVLTETDKSDLKLLYQLAWSGALKDINGTAIRLVTPFHMSGGIPDRLTLDPAVFRPAASRCPGAADDQITRVVAAQLRTLLCTPRGQAERLATARAVAAPRPGRRWVLDAVKACISDDSPETISSQDTLDKWWIPQGLPALALNLNAMFASWAVEVARSQLKVTMTVAAVDELVWEKIVEATPESPAGGE